MESRSVLTVPTPRSYESSFLPKTNWRSPAFEHVPAQSAFHRRRPRAFRSFGRDIYTGHRRNRFDRQNQLNVLTRPGPVSVFSRSRINMNTNLPLKTQPLTILSFDTRQICQIDTLIPETVVKKLFGIGAHSEELTPYTFVEDALDPELRTTPTKTSQPNDSESQYFLDTLSFYVNRGYKSINKSTYKEDTKRRVILLKYMLTLNPTMPHIVEDIERIYPSFADKKYLSVYRGIALNTNKLGMTELPELLRKPNLLHPGFISTSLSSLIASGFSLNPGVEEGGGSMHKGFIIIRIPLTGEWGRRPPLLVPRQIRKLTVQEYTHRLGDPDDPEGDMDEEKELREESRRFNNEADEIILPLGTTLTRTQICRMPIQRSRFDGTAYGGEMVVVYDAHLPTRSQFEGWLTDFNKK